MGDWRKGGQEGLKTSRALCMPAMATEEKLIPFTQVNAFTGKAFAGNPAAVVHLDAPRGAEWMQAIAAEFNLAETAFLIPHTADDGSQPEDTYGLRWFTPKAEVPLCGHATLASAHTLFSPHPQLGVASPAFCPRGDVLSFHTLSGVLVARRASDGGVELDFPGAATTELPAAKLAAVGEAVGVRDIAWAGQAASTNRELLVEVTTPEAVTGARPDFAKITALSESCGAVGVIVTARGGAPGAGDGVDFVSRFFAPAVGIPEDPVTGSAHTTLAHYWSGRLKKNPLEAYQASARGGRVGVRVEPESGRVYLRGDAVTLFIGSILPSAS